MGIDTRKATSRREFLTNTGRVTAASTLLAAMSPRLYAGEDNTIRLALVGCGGRGSGAAANAMARRACQARRDGGCLRGRSNAAMTA
jgi:hypothetical protein